MSQLQQPQINLAQTTEVTTLSGGKIFTEGFLIRKASRFLLGSDQDAYVPVPVFYCIEDNEILWEMLSPEIRALYNK